MSVRDALTRVLDNLPERRLREVLVFAESLSWQEERGTWRQLGQAQLARAYGPAEREYTRANIKPERQRMADNLRP